VQSVTAGAKAHHPGVSAVLQKLRHCNTTVAFAPPSTRPVAPDLFVVPQDDGYYTTFHGATLGAAAESGRRRRHSQRRQEQERGWTGPEDWAQTVDRGLRIRRKLWTEKKTIGVHEYRGRNIHLLIRAYDCRSLCTLIIPCQVVATARPALLVRSHLCHGPETA
jgi:hypothetical protein